MKKIIISLILAFTVILTLIPCTVVNAQAVIQLGDYVQMGTYYGEPILWRCVAFEKISGYDDKGNPIIDSTDTVTKYKEGYLPLMLSDKIISIKPFDARGINQSNSNSHSRRETNSPSNYWCDSNIRSWLNSEEKSNQVKWLCNNAPIENMVYEGDNDYSEEAGFLSNFSASEKNLIKEVQQKSIVSKPEIESHIYTTGSEYYIYSWNINNAVKNYDKAYSEYISDKVFLIDVKQVDNIYKNQTELGIGYHIGVPTEKCVKYSEHQEKQLNSKSKYWYWLRTPVSTNGFDVRDVFCDGHIWGDRSIPLACYGQGGIRPAFFLDLENSDFVYGDGSENNPYAMDTTITSVTRSSIVQNRYYGAQKYQNTNKGDVYDLANDFNDACLNYISAVHGVAESDTGIDIEKAAERLQEADSNSNKKWLTYVSLPDKAVDAAYMAYADYLQSIVNKGTSLGKINLSDDIISINAKMINQIRDNITISLTTYKYNGFNISLSVTGYRNTSFGTMTLKKGSSSYIVTVCTKPTETANAICSYINELRDVTEDVLQQGIQALVSELADITGFYDFEKELIEERVKKYTGKLREHGYGNVLKNVKKCYDGYDVIKDVIRWNDAKHITDELDDAETLYKKITMLSYTDTDVDNLIISQALNKLETARKKLADGLYDYVYHSTGSQPDEPGFFDKVDSWWSSWWQCPVDFTVYDESGDEIGYVRNGIVYYTDDIYIETSSDVKKLYVPQGMKVSVEMHGNDEGTFNYIIEEVTDKEPTGRLNYYGIPLTKETTYSQTLNSSNLSSEIDSVPIVSEDSTINANEYLSADDAEAYVVITTECEGNGVAIGGGNYAKGDSVKLTAISSVDNYKFSGWYINNELVSTDIIYQFTALENATVKAVFEKQYIIDDNYFITITEDYEENLQVSVCKNNSYTNDIVIISSLESYAENIKLYCNAYSQSNEIIINNQSLTALYDEKYSYIVENIDFSECYKIELLNEKGFIIANIIRNVDDTDIYISNDIVNSIFISRNYVSGDIELYNKSDENKDVWCGIATYDNDNSLIGILGTDILVNANSPTDFNLTFESDTKPHHIKVFVWDGLNELVPMTKTINIENVDY